jgi:hypothetical protein
LDGQSNTKKTLMAIVRLMSWYPSGLISIGCLESHSKSTSCRYPGIKISRNNASEHKENVTAAINLITSECAITAKELYLQGALSLIELFRAMRYNRAHGAVLPHWEGEG